MALLLIGCSAATELPPPPTQQLPPPTSEPSIAAISSPDIPEDGDWSACNGAGYAIAYPAGWFVHEPDELAGVGQCSLFAALPFEGGWEPDGGWTGAQLVLVTGEGCRGSFEVVTSETELEIQNYPAWARDLAVGEGPNAGEPSAYEYHVNLSPEHPCELGRWFVGRTEVSAPGDHTDNKAVLDEMMTSLRFDS